MRFLTKKTVVGLFILASALSLSLIHFRISTICSSEWAYGWCSISFWYLGFSFWFALLLLPSFLTLPLRYTVFNTWKKFAIVAIPVVLVLTYFISQMSSGGGIGVVGVSPAPLLLALLYGAYFLISLGIIIVTFLKTRAGKRS
jgi:hypothetical protein